jgi:hypothetical protein
MERLRGDLKPPEGVDAPAINAIIVSGISYFVLASRTSGTVIGLVGNDEKTWTRISNAILGLVDGAYRK